VGLRISERSRVHWQRIKKKYTVWLGKESKMKDRAETGNAGENAKGGFSRLI